MIGIVHHGANQVIQARINSNKRPCRIFFDNVGFHQQMPAFAHQKFTRLEPKFEVPAVLLTEILESCRYLTTQFDYIRHMVAFFVGHFKAATEVDKCQIWIVGGEIEQDIGPRRKASAFLKSEPV